MIKTILPIVFVSLLASDCLAEKASAVCDEPTGWTIANLNGKTSDEEDGFKGAKTTYSWEIGSKKATIVTQNSALVGGSLLTFEAIVIPVTKRQISFLFQYEDGIELHSLFLDTGDLFLSIQKDWAPLDPKGSMGKIFKAKCIIRIN